MNLCIFSHRGVTFTQANYNRQLLPPKFIIHADIFIQRISHL